MIHPDTDLKFRVIMDAEGFNQKKDPWRVKIVDTFGRCSALLTPEDCIQDTAGRHYFLLPSVRTGKYYAVTSVDIPDEDYDDGYMTVVDRQPLIDVGMCPSLRNACTHSTDGLEVTFVRVMTRNIDDTLYLADINGNYIVDDAGKRIALLKE